MINKKAQSIVSIVKGDRINKMVREAVALLGQQFVKSGDVVLIKPNLVSAQPPPITTRPEIVKTLVQMCLEAGAAKVLVGDSPAIGVGTTSRKVITASGMDKAVTEVGGKIIYFDEEESKEIEVHKGKVLNKIRVPSCILESNVIIDVPVLKIHLQTVFTGAIKNWHGLLYDQQKELYHRSDINQKLVDIHTVIKSDLVVFDAITGIEGQGPCWGTEVPMNLIMAANDPVSADAVASAVIGIDPFDVPTTYLAHYRKVGNGLLKNIKIVGKQIEEVKRIFKRATCELNGVIDEFEIFEGGTCLEGCKANLRVAFDAINSSDEKKNIIRKANKKVGFIIGRRPAILTYPDYLSRIKSDILFLIGDCVIEATTELRSFTQQYKKGGRKVILDLGCPPIGWITTYGKIIKEYGIPFEELY